MKKEMSLQDAVTAISIFMGLALIIILLQGCSKTNATPPTAIEKNTQLLEANTWKLQSVQVDGVDKTTAFAGMFLKFTSTDFSTTSSNMVWPTSGTWSFTDATANAFKRDDGLIVTINSINTNSLQLNLTWTQTTLGGGRAGSVAGQYVFNFMP